VYVLIHVARRPRDPRPASRRRARSRASPERAAPAPPRRRVTALRTRHQRTKLPTRTPHGSRGESPAARSRPDRALPHPEAQGQAALPNPPDPPLPLLAGRPPAPPCRRAPRSAGRGRNKEGRHWRTPAHLAAGPPTAPRPRRCAPLRFRRSTKAPAADRQHLTAGAEDQTSSESVAECAGTYRNRGRTQRPAQCGAALRHQRPTRSRRQGERSEGSSHGERA